MLFLLQVSYAADAGRSRDGDALGGHSRVGIDIVERRVASALSDGDKDLTVVHHRHVARGLSRSDVELVGESGDVDVALRLHIDDSIVACGARRGRCLVVVEF